MQLGSSPLARGLPRLLLTDALSVGIIPARAGFTRRPRGKGRRHSDHPRSRGVYAVIVRLTGIAPGSSPLARGLRLRASASDVTLRIIPARAGFTECVLPHPLQPPDHPRSRGVYRAAASA